MINKVYNYSIMSADFTDRDRPERAIRMTCSKEDCETTFGIPMGFLNRVVFGHGGYAVVEAQPIAKKPCQREDCGDTMMVASTTSPETLVWLRAHAPEEIVENDPGLHALAVSHIPDETPDTPTDLSDGEDRHLSIVPAVHPEPS